MTFFGRQAPRHDDLFKKETKVKDGSPRARGHAARAATCSPLPLHRQKAVLALARLAVEHLACALCTIAHHGGEVAVEAPALDEGR